MLTMTMTVRTVFRKLVLPWMKRHWRRLTSPIQEHCEQEDTNEAVEMLRDLNLGDMKSEVPALAVTLALGGKG